MKKRKSDAFPSVCMSLVTMPLKQQVISTEPGVKDLLVTGQYDAGFFVGDLNFEDEPRRNAYSVKQNATSTGLLMRPKFTFITMLGHMLPGRHSKCSLTWYMRFCRMRHILLISHPLTVIFSSIWSLFLISNEK